jgi:Zn-finger nucleic acid-binding protein
MTTQRQCPRCRSVLAPTSLLEGGRVQVDVCPQCCGIWFDADELQAILAAAADEQARVDRQLIGALADRNAGPEEVHCISCPVCSAAMNRCTHGHRSGVVADRCVAHGVWLDGSELETLFDWVAADGNPYEAQVAAERRWDDARREPTGYQRQGGSVALAEPPRATSRGGRHRSGGWLADALADVLEHIVS